MWPRRIGEYGSLSEKSGENEGMAVERGGARRSGGGARQATLEGAILACGVLQTGLYWIA